VPRRPELSEWFELAEADRAVLGNEIARAAGRLKGWAKGRGPCDKINIATIGNLVSQLHIHVVARAKSDSAWPGTVWGAGQAAAYGAAELARVVEELRAGL